MELFSLFQLSNRSPFRITIARVLYLRIENYYCLSFLSILSVFDTSLRVDSVVNEDSRNT